MTESPADPVALDAVDGAAEGAHLPDLAIITGMSGAGRSTTANVLEDLGWFVVDNLPPALLPTLAELGGRSRGDVARMAAVVDVRSRAFFADLTAALAQLAADGSDPRIIFLEASDDSLVRRHEVDQTEQLRVRQECQDLLEHALGAAIHSQPIMDHRNSEPFKVIRQ